jgi:hypothetical protein
MVSRKNLMEIVKKLMQHMDRAEGTTYRDELMFQIIQICSQNDYQVGHYAKEAKAQTQQDIGLTSLKYRHSSTLLCSILQSSEHYGVDVGNFRHS